MISKLYLFQKTHVSTHAYADLHRQAREWQVLRMNKKKEKKKRHPISNVKTSGMTKKVGAKSNDLGTPPQISFSAF